MELLTCCVYDFALCYCSCRADNTGRAANELITCLTFHGSRDVGGSRCVYKKRPFRISIFLFSFSPTVLTMSAEETKPTAVAETTPAETPAQAPAAEEPKTTTTTTDAAPAAEESKAEKPAESSDDKPAETQEAAKTESTPAPAPTPTPSRSSTTKRLSVFLNKAKKQFSDKKEEKKPEPPVKEEAKAEETPKEPEATEASAATEAKAEEQPAAAAAAAAGEGEASKSEKRKSKFLNGIFNRSKVNFTLFWVDPRGPLISQQCHDPSSA